MIKNLLAGAAALVATATLSAAALAAPAHNVSDAALVSKLPGFVNAYATVGGVRLHYVAGGKGPPLFLLPGWPETWWAYRKVMPDLARTHRVIVVDIRGMGSSAKPAGGYDKKTMADDIAALAASLGYAKIDLVGHDIGSMVAYSLAASDPELVSKLVLVDVGPPSAGYWNLKLLPEPGTFTDTIDPDHPYFWWFAFHQVKGMPDELLEGRAGIEQAWFFRYMAKDQGAIDPLARAVYAAAYSTREGTRAGNAWYQSFAQDIDDNAKFAKLTMPVLGLGGPGYKRLKAAIDGFAPGSQTILVEGSGHFIAEEKPTEMIRLLHGFLDAPDGAGTPPRSAQ